MLSVYGLKTPSETNNFILQHTNYTLTISEGSGIDNPLKKGFVENISKCRGSKSPATIQFSIQIHRHRSITDYMSCTLQKMF